MENAELQKISDAEHKIANFPITCNEYEMNRERFYFGHCIIFFE